jgi:hypothetical protein
VFTRVATRAFLVNPAALFALCLFLPASPLPPSSVIQSLLFVMALHSAA